MTLTVDQLWRYPVKTLAGERVGTAQLTVAGISADRIVHVRGPEGVRTSRIHSDLLGLLGTLGPDGKPLIDGAIAAFGRDVRRLRPNIVISGVDGRPRHPGTRPRGVA